jgi:hypothetical protein
MFEQLNIRVSLEERKIIKMAQAKGYSLRKIIMEGAKIMTKTKGKIGSNLRSPIKIC